MKRFCKIRNIFKRLSSQMHVSHPPPLLIQKDIPLKKLAASKILIMLLIGCNTCNINSTFKFKSL